MAGAEEFPIIIRAQDQASNVFNDVVKKSNTSLTALDKKVFDVNSRFGGLFKTLRQGFDSLFTRLTGFSTAGIPLANLLPVIAGIVIAVRALPRLWEGFTSALDKSDRSASRMGITGRNLVATFDDVSRGVGDLTGSIPFLSDALDGLNGLAKGFAHTLTLTNYGLSTMAATARYLKSYFSESDSVERLKLTIKYGKEMEALEDRMYARFEDISFEIDRTAQGAGTVKRELSEWEKIVRRMNEGVLNDARGGIFEMIQLLRSPEGGNFRGFLEEQKRIESSFAGVADVILGSFDNLTERQFSLLDSMSKGAALTQSQTQALGELFQGIESAMASFGGAAELLSNPGDNILSQILDALGAYKKELQETSKETDFWKASLSGAFGDVLTAADATFAAIINGTMSAGVAFKVFGLQVVNALGSVARQKSLFHFAEGVAALAFGSANPVLSAAQHFRAAAMFGALSLATFGATQAGGLGGSVDTSRASTNGAQRERDIIATAPPTAKEYAPMNITVVVEGHVMAQGNFIDMILDEASKRGRDGRRVNVNVRGT